MKKQKREIIIEEKEVVMPEDQDNIIVQEKFIKEPVIDEFGNVFYKKVPAPTLGDVNKLIADHQTALADLEELKALLEE